jgi:hypothetical protein
MPEMAICTLMQINSSGRESGNDLTLHKNFPGEGVAKDAPSFLAHVDRGRSHHWIAGLR